jgi:hypothetical protein
MTQVARNKLLLLSFWGSALAHTNLRFPPAEIDRNVLHGRLLIPLRH